MNTPITYAAGKAYANGGALSDLLRKMSRLELDRAALMEALELILSAGSDSWSDAVAKDALATARANFPES